MTLVGLGNWGSSLAQALRSAGLPIPEVVVRALPHTQPQRRSGLDFVTVAEANLDAEILWICVPDAAIAEVAEQLVRRRGDLRGQAVLHSSGALTVDCLRVAERAGARVGSVHPVMSFPTRDPVPLATVLFGVEAAPVLRRKLYGLVKALGGIPFAVASENKALYHAAGTLASPLLVSALGAAVAAARYAGLSSTEAQRFVAPLAQATVRNYFERGPRKSFSGPFARGDSATIDLHLQALQPHPILAAVYRALAKNALETLPVRRRAELRKVLDAPSRSSSKPTQKQA